MSNRFTFSIVIFALFLGLILSPDVNAGKTNPKPKPPVDPRILVVSVDLAKNQVTLLYKRDNRKHTYIIDNLTKVVVSGNPGTLKDIRVGLQVFSYIERDDVALDNIEVAIADPAPVAPK